MFGTQRLCTIFCLCLQILPEWIDEVSRDWPLIYWGGREGEKGNPNLPLPYLKFPPPQTFLASQLESRFSPCSLRNIEYCCVISPYSPLLPPYFPLFLELPPPALTSPFSRTPPTLFSSGPQLPDLFDFAKRTYNSGQNCWDNSIYFLTFAPYSRLP